MKKLHLIFCLSMYLVITGCATPHTFVNTYTPETLPVISSGSDIHTLSGSAFLRQRGGGIVSCAGKTVKAEREIPIQRNDYVKEYSNLSQFTKDATKVDERMLDFDSKLKTLIDANTFTTTCDIDGKFQIGKLKSGVYTVSTHIVWTVGDKYQGGIVAEVVVIPDKTEPTITNTVLNKLVAGF